RDKVILLAKDIKNYNYIYISISIQTIQTVRFIIVTSKASDKFVTTGSRSEPRTLAKRLIYI
ncbi:MAG: hypothetical protein PHO31_03340, partial [Candidatus Pacebacteria bacterium]|nr:hypothetical protein [Candidatus Paceibacterota bacterium]